MQDRPTAAELLDAIADFLTLDVAPHVPRWLAFQLRVARNSLMVIKREIEHEEAHLVEEWLGLDALLGDAPRPGSLQGLRQALRARNEELCRRIQAGEFDRPDLRRLLVGHLDRTVRNKLLVCSPRYAAG